jgi:emfourin
VADEPTRITVQRSGGLAGLLLRRTVAPGGLEAEDAAELRRLLAGADLEAPALRPRGADRFQYDLWIESGPRRRHTVAHEGTMPAGTRALCEWVLGHGTSE